MNVLNWSVYYLEISGMVPYVGILLPIVLRDHKIEQMINEPIKLKKAKRKTSYSIYYKELYESRSTEVYIKTADELNIKYNKRGENVAKLEDDLEPEELDVWLTTNNKMSRLKFYRDINTIYGNHIYNDIASIMLKHLKKDKLTYESSYLIRKME